MNWLFVIYWWAGEKCQRFFLLQLCSTDCYVIDWYPSELVYLCIDSCFALKLKLSMSDCNHSQWQLRAPVSCHHSDRLCILNVLWIESVVIRIPAFDYVDVMFHIKADKKFKLLQFHLNTTKKTDIVSSEDSKKSPFSENWPTLMGNRAIVTKCNPNVVIKTYNENNYNLPTL